jgi:hypothetical protein
MGRPPERATRLHFRTADVFRENAHGPGPGEYRGARASGTRGSPTGRSAVSRNLARAARCCAGTGRCSVRGKSKSASSSRFADSSVANFETSGIAFPDGFPDNIPDSDCHTVSAKGITSFEADCVTSASRLSRDVAIHSTS